MAKVRIKTRAVQKLINQTFEGVSKREKTLRQITTFIRDRIVAFARSGKNMRLNKPLPKLSKSYKDFRKGNVHFRTSKTGDVFPIKGKDPDFPPTGSFFKPTRSKSNLTLTGQLLESLEVSRDGRFINLKEGRNDGKLNKNIIKWLKRLDDDYDFLPKRFENLDDKTQKRVKRIVLDELRRELRKNNLK